MKELYKFFKHNGKLQDIVDYDPSIMDIFSREVLARIQNGEPGWEEQVPDLIPEMIKQNNFFGYKKS